MNVHNRIWEKTKEDLSQAIGVIKDNFSDDEDSSEESESGDEYESSSEEDQFFKSEKSRVKDQLMSKFSPKMKRKNTHNSHVSKTLQKIGFKSDAQNTLKMMIKIGNEDAHRLILSAANTLKLNDKYYDFVCQLAEMTNKNFRKKQIENFSIQEMIDLANVRFKALLDYLCEEEGKLSPAQVVQFKLQVNSKEPIMISLMELYFTGKYDQRELVDTLFLLWRCICNKGKKTFRIKVSFSRILRKFTILGRWEYYRQRSRVRDTHLLA